MLHLASSKSHQSWLREACRKVGAREYDSERVGPTVTQQEEGSALGLHASSSRTLEAASSWETASSVTPHSSSAAPVP